MYWSINQEIETLACHSYKQKWCDYISGTTYYQLIKLEQYIIYMFQTYAKNKPLPKRGWNKISFTYAKPQPIYNLLPKYSYDKTSSPWVKLFTLIVALQGFDP